MSVLAAATERVRMVDPVRVTGTVVALRGLTMLAEALPLPVGSLARVGGGVGVPVEVVGFDGGRAILMPLGPITGVRSGDRVSGHGAAASVGAGEGLLGRVINGLGAPIDGGPAPRDLAPRPIDAPAVAAMRRRPIDAPLATGVRAIDTMATVGRGQRLGIFAGPGVGKSTLLGMLARNTSADVNVIALIGERGREVRDFIDRSLGAGGLSRSVVVVATSDESPLLRVRAASAACAVAEHFRDRGADVLLMVDSITRFAHAQRQIGLAVGEPPATKGYTPSVFAALPALLERAGTVEASDGVAAGSITGFYTVLVEGDDMTEPVSDAVRGILDGHVVLARRLAQRGHYPAIDVLDSVSRLADDLCDERQVGARREVQRLLAAYRDVEELLQIGAYASGSNPATDRAVQLKPRLDALLQQRVDEPAPFAGSWEQLMSVASAPGAAAPQRR